VVRGTFISRTTHHVPRITFSVSIKAFPADYNNIKRNDWQCSSTGLTAFRFHAKFRYLKSDGLVERKIS
jgi:hypothetical protein